MTWRRRAAQVFRRFGYDLQRYNSHVGTPADRRIKLMKHHGINLLFDVGANTGQYARGMRGRGVTGRIISFEPLSSAFAALSESARKDDLWVVQNYALGDRDGEAEINVAGNSQSSSLLAMLPAHLERTPQARTVGTEPIQIRRLESLMPEFVSPGDRPFLKVDAQGYERAVIAGAGPRIAEFVGVQLEVGLIPLYAGETLLVPMVTFMESLGFVLMSLEPGFCDTRTGQLLQTDCIFFRA